MKEDEVDLLIKIVLCGESGVGKTNLLTRYIREFFDPDVRPTIGVDFFTKDITHGQLKANVQLFDTAGQEKFRSISSSYFKNCEGIVIVYDVTDRTKFDLVSSWIAEARSTAQSDVDILLIGNKIDLNEQRQVTTDEGETFAKNNNLLFMETSALTNQDRCVAKAFELVIARIIERVGASREALEHLELEEIKRKSLKLKPHKFVVEATKNGKKSCC